MIKKILITATILAAMFLVSCTENTGQSATSTTGTETLVTQQPQQTETTQATTAETTTAQTTAASTTTAVTISQEAKKFIGTFTVFAEPSNYMTITYKDGVYTAKLNVVSNNSAPSIPVGEYTAAFNYDDIHDYGDGICAVLAKTEINGNEQSFIIDFYVEGDSASGLSVYLNESGFEMIKGRPA